MADGSEEPRLEACTPNSEVTDMFTTIVVGVDGLPGGRDALALAQRLADLAGGELVAVHVHPETPFPLRGLRSDIEAVPAASEVAAR
jgi:nucleotide-binding universal stress UspA family protein